MNFPGSRLQLWLLSLLLLLPATFIFAAERARALDPAAAFNLQITVNQHRLDTKITIAPGYYLYKSKLIFRTEPEVKLGTPRMSAASLHEDEFFGRQLIYRQNARIILPIPNSAPDFKLTVSLQGCADIGICYPPLIRNFLVNGNKVIPLTAVTPPKLAATADNALSVRRWQPVNCRTQNDNAAARSEHFGQYLLLFLLAGIAMSLTACMYPLIPLVAAIIINNKKERHPGKKFGAVFIYTQGIALTYALLGIISGLTGTLLNVYLQQKIFIIPAGIIIMLLGLAMLDFFQLGLPAFWQNYLNSIALKKRQKNYGLLLMGMLSALIIGPCIAPPLAFALGYIGTTHNYMYGGIALYLMGLGLGIPLLLFSLAGSRLLPKSGVWMTVLKHFMGLILLFLAVYITAPFLPDFLTVCFYVLLLLLPILLIYRTDAGAGKKRRPLLFITIVLSLGLCSALLLNAAVDKVPALNRLLAITPAGSNNSGLFIPPNQYTDAAGLMRRINRELKTKPGQTIFLDFYARWCATCKKMAQSTFADSAVQKTARQKGLWLQINLTDNTPEQRLLLRAFGLYAPPALVVITAPANYCREPLLGFKNPAGFLIWLGQQP